MAVYTRDGSTTDSTPKASKDMSDITLSTNEILKELRRNAKSGGLSSVMDSNRNEDKSPEAQSDREWKQRERQRRRAQWDSTMKKVEQGYDRHFKDLNDAFTNPLAGVAKGMDGMVKGLFTKTGALMNTKLGDILPKKKPTADEPTKRMTADLKKRKGESDRRYQARLKPTANLRNQRRQEQDARTKAKATLKKPKQGEKISGQLQSLIDANKRADKDRKELVLQAKLSNLTVGGIVLGAAGVFLALPPFIATVAMLLNSADAYWKYLTKVQLPVFFTGEHSIQKQISAQVVEGISSALRWAVSMIKGDFEKEISNKKLGDTTVAAWSKAIVNPLKLGIPEEKIREVYGSDMAAALLSDDFNENTRAVWSIGPNALLDQMKIWLNDPNLSDRTRTALSIAVNNKNYRGLEFMPEARGLIKKVRAYIPEAAVASVSEKYKAGREEDYYDKMLDVLREGGNTENEAYHFMKWNGLPKETIDRVIIRGRSEGVWKEESTLEKVERKGFDVLESYVNTTNDLLHDIFISTTKRAEKFYIGVPDPTITTATRK